MVARRVGAPGALIAWLVGDEISPSPKKERDCKNIFKEASKTRNEWYNQVEVLDYFALIFFYFKL